MTLYTLTAECKQSPQTEEKESTADAMKAQQKQLSLEETIERARDIVQRAKVCQCSSVQIQKIPEVICMYLLT